MFSSSYPNIFKKPQAQSHAWGFGVLAVLIHTYRHIVI
ncbi:hypothetical protein AO376_0839 [Moraxella catarrhalis]|nr:hypothetical protein AO376_0839 [Moraxella catarrhalis]OAV17426.1 hypothetical protein AO374_1213 [Moraxella catarrhalis]